MHTPRPQIQASDGGVPPRRKEHTLRVTILDVNDNPPVIESPFGYNVSVSEVSPREERQLRGSWIIKQ